MKKNLILLSLLVIMYRIPFAQNVGIGTSTPHSSAQLDISSATKGFLIPRMNTNAINAVNNPAKGLMIFDSAINQLMVNAGTNTIPKWQTVAGTNVWSVTGNSNTDPAIHFFGTTDNKPLLFRLNNKAAGRIDSISQFTSLGYGAGRLSGSGPVSANTAVGFKSLYSNLGGIYNLAAGAFALYSNTTGSGNTALGMDALRSNTDGGSNTGVGTGALYSNTSGNHNTASGHHALYANTTGSYNMAQGAWALANNTTGSYNAGIGYGTLMDNTTGIYNTAIGAYALTDNTVGSYNTGIGYASLNLNLTGIANTAAGHHSLFNNSIGSYNTASGNASLFNNINGDYNTAMGYGTLYANTSGHDNVAIGSFTLYSNSGGVFNTALGNASMYYNTTGNDNAAVGIHTLFSNTTGSKNSVLGWRAMYANTTGYYNAAVGDGALYANSVGVGNTAMGSGALYSTVAASYNTTYGFHAGFSYELGWNNTLIGAETNVTASGIYNSIALGSSVSISASNQVRIGNFSTASIGGYAGWTHFSDGRFKKNIREDVMGLNFIMKLRPVTYQLDVASLSTALNPKTESLKSDKMQSAIAEKGSSIQTGLIAQEVEQAARESGYEFSGVDKPKNENDFYGLRYAEFVVPLIKAVQEQQGTIQSLKLQVEELKQKMSTLLQDKKTQ